MFWKVVSTKLKNKCNVSIWKCVLTCKDYTEIDDRTNYLNMELREECRLSLRLFNLHLSRKL